MYNQSLRFAQKHVIFLHIIIIVLCILFPLTVGAYLLQRHRKKHTDIIDKTEFCTSQTLVISNEEGGGEADTEMSDFASLASKQQYGLQASPATSRSESLASKASRATESKKKINIYHTVAPILENAQEKTDGEANVRSNSPVIRAYLQEKINAANADSTSIDSTRKFCDESSESDSASLSSTYSQLSIPEEDNYTMERLKAAGPQLSSLIPLLEHVLDNDAANIGNGLLRTSDIKP